MSYNVPTAYDVSEPVLIDKKISEIQARLDTLTWLDRSFHRAYKMVTEDPRVLYPGIYQPNLDYVSLMPNDGINGNTQAYSFVYVKQPQPITDYNKNNVSQTAEISIIFFIDLSKFTKEDNQITNGGFITDTDWTKGTGWTIAGLATCDGSQAAASELEQENVIGKNQYLYYEFDWNRVSGELRLRSDNTTHRLIDSGTQGKAFGYFRASPTSDGKIQFQANIDFVGTVDNVVIRKSTYDHRFTERLKVEILNKLSTVGQLKITATYDDAEEAYGDFTTTAIEAKYLDSRKFAALRFDAEIEYQQKCKL